MRRGSRNWRVVFRFEGVRFCDVDLIDYHQEDLICDEESTPSGPCPSVTTAWSLWDSA